MNTLLDTNLLLSFCLTATVIVLVPGPSVLFVVSRALMGGRPAAVAAAAGDTMGQTLQGVMAALGVGALIAESAVLYNGIKFGGAIYLVFMGATTLKYRQFSTVGGDAAPVDGRRQELRRGFTVGLTNPKTVVFFAAALPQFVDPARGYVVLQMLALLLVYSVISMFGDTSWGLAGDSLRSWTADSPRRIEGLIASGGLCIIGVGLWVALSHHAA